MHYAEGIGLKKVVWKVKIEQWFVCKSETILTAKNCRWDEEKIDLKPPTRPESVKRTQIFSPFLAADCNWPK